MIDHEFEPHPHHDDVCWHWTRLGYHDCGQPRSAHRTAQTPTADATASARLTAEADADGTGSRVEVPERVCARCEGAAKWCDKYAEHRQSFQEDNAQDEYARGEAIATAEELGRSIRSACLAAHHARDDAALRESVREIGYALDAAYEPGCTGPRRRTAEDRVYRAKLLQERLAARLAALARELPEEKP